MLRWSFPRPPLARVLRCRHLVVARRSLNSTLRPRCARGARFYVCSSLVFDSSWIVHHNAVFDVWWCPDDRLATASGDLTAQVTDIATRAAVARLVGHRGSVKSVRHSPTQPRTWAGWSP